MKMTEKGFTLIELMVTIAIMAIMLAVAIPSFSEWMAKRKVTATAEKVANAIRFGRSEAVRLNRPVYLCPVLVTKNGNPNAYCNPAVAGSGLALWADAEPFDKQYKRSEDQSLRTAILNKPGTDIQIHYKMTSINYSGASSSSGSDVNVLAFLPDGTIRRYLAPAAGGINAVQMTGTGSPIAGYVKYIFTDGQARDRNTRERRSVVMLVSGNQVTFCDSSNNSAACNYEDIDPAECRRKSQYGGC